MKRTVAALAVGLLPGLSVATTSAAATVASTSEPAASDDATTAADDDAASPDTAEGDAAAEGDAESEGDAAPQPKAPTPPPPEERKGPKASGDAKAGGKITLGGGAEADAEGEGKRRRGKKEPVDPATVTDDPKAYEKAVVKQRPWIQRWEPARHLVELGAFGGMLRISDDHDLYDPRTRPQDPLWRVGPDVGFRAAYFPLEPLGVEAEFSANPTRARTITNDPVFVYGFRGHVILQIPKYRIVPFLLGGYGLMGIRSHILIQGNDIDPALHYGGGVKMYITKRLVARIEARQIVSSIKAQQDSGTSHFQALAGISLVLGRKKIEPPPYVEPVDPDRDKDGILNETDECPDEAGPGPSGCPDTDGDGFIDKVDACIEVPGVEPDGCPLKDSDDDKILDIDDDCPFEPETYNGLDDEDGCPDELPPDLIVYDGKPLPGIEFDFGKDTIRPESTPILDDVVATLQKYPGLRVRIVGHTDNIGTPEANLELSKRRAESVKRYLVEGGVDESRIETDGKGQTEPVDPADTEEARAKNRRIEFFIIANEPTEVLPPKSEREGGKKGPDAKTEDGGDAP